MNKYALSQLIKQESKRLGFDSCGISKAERLDEEAQILEDWLNQRRQGEMAYMANHFEKRVDPRQLVMGAKSVISLSFNYYTDKKQRDEEAPKIAMYAYGKDYHIVIKQRLEQLLQFIREKTGAVTGRCFVDSAPVLEKAWAKKSGLGWIGKNTNVLDQAKRLIFLSCRNNSRP